MKESAAAQHCRTTLLSFHYGDLATLQLSNQMFQTLFGFIAQNSFTGQERYAAPPCICEEKERAQQSKGNDRLVPTFNLQDQSGGATLVSVLHSHGVVPAVLLLGSDQGQDAHVAAWDNKGITAMTAGSKGQGKVWLSS